MEEARLPAADVEPWRSGGHSLPSGQGPEAALGLIWRIRDRRTFARLRTEGQRGRSGPVTVTYLPEAAKGAKMPPRVAFSTGKRVGVATVRNRVRRRLRSAMNERTSADRSPEVRLRSGSYLVSSGPGLVDADWESLQEHLDRALSRAHGS
ncbi:MAG: ribonuclease P protein component [Actinomycetia bacterium]|nr:ribonuclease P protein component [Actinomycetes bacterium]